jgi:polar amino acid transport system ATP-binding protein
MNVLQNIILGPMRVEKRSKEEAMEEALKLLERVGLTEKKLAYPRELSGGQKQRVAICRALCMNPDIILFDEVTAALDPEMVREVLDVIKGLSEQGYTMVVVTHEMAFAEKVADKIIFMEDGRIVEVNTPEKFFSMPDTIEARRFLNLSPDKVLKVLSQKKLK